MVELLADHEFMSLSYSYDRRFAHKQRRREAHRKLGNMTRSTLFCALAVGQLAVVASFVTVPTAPRLVTAPSSSCRPAYHLPSSKTTTTCRASSRFQAPKLAINANPLQQHLSFSPVATISSPRMQYSSSPGKEHEEQKQHRAAGRAPSSATAPGLSEFLDLNNSNRNINDGVSQSPSRFAALTASTLAAGLAVAVLAPGPAAAAAKAVATAAGSAEHLHVGQKIANFFRRGGLPDWATLMTISAMPVVELRGGVPVGIWMGMPIAKVFGLCVAGNMIPIPVILLALRSSFVQKLAKPVLDRAREKAASFGDEKSQALALTLFVGIPLPGTGAWTGAMGAFLLGMSFQKAMLSIFLGVLSAGMIMSCLTLAGKAGALVATVILAVFCVSNIMGSSGGETKASDFSTK